MKIIEVIRIRIVIFIIQILILSLFIFYMGYESNINFDPDTLKEQEIIIQFLANYVLFNDTFGLWFIYLIWIIVSLIPIFIYYDFKKAYSMNLLTFFFPNFFVYAFLRHYSRKYLDSYFPFHFLHTILLGLLIIIISIGLSLFLKKVSKLMIKTQVEDLYAIASTNKSICPNCGTEFNSIPQFCYNCNAKLIRGIEDNNIGEKE